MHIKFNDVDVNRVDLPCRMPKFETDASVAGFGVTDGNLRDINFSNTLKWLAVKTIAPSVCHQNFGLLDPDFIEGREDAFCAKHPNTDSGNPGPGMCNVSTDQIH